MAFKHTVFEKWLEDNEEYLLPPVCNKLLHGGQLKVMFVGGKKANERGDYHVEDGEEFFYMLKGQMTLKVVEQGKHRDIIIKQGEAFLLPPRIPHSPQRPPNSLGLVIERERLQGELDAMQWYVKGSADILWRRTFHCTDLGKDLVPIIKAYKASQESKSGKARERGSKGGDGVLAIMPLEKPIDEKTQLPEPQKLKTWVKSKTQDLKSGPLTLFKGSDFEVTVVTGNRRIGPRKAVGEMYYYLLEGSGEVESKDTKQKEKMVPSSMVIVRPKAEHTVSVRSDAVLLAVSWPYDLDVKSIGESPNVPDETPILTRDSDYANLKADDFEDNKTPSP
ncbi:hypothetical protein AAMO2058_001257700 [Amorphochlora amoebiformis]